MTRKANVRRLAGRFYQTDSGMWSERKNDLKGYNEPIEAFAYVPITPESVEIMTVIVAKAIGMESYMCEADKSPYRSAAVDALTAIFGKLPLPRTRKRRE